MMTSDTGLKYILWALLLTAAVWAAGCNSGGGGDDDDDSSIDGGPCTYQNIPGTATVVSVSDADPNDYNCTNDPVEVLFDFVPQDPSRDAFLDRHFMVANGANPPRDWAMQQGLTEGSQHPCILKEIVTGTCSPYIFDFTDINEEDGAQHCW